LKDTAPKLERDAKKRLKNDVKPIVADAKAAIPGSPPLSKWVAPKGGGGDGVYERYAKKGSGQPLPIWSSTTAKRRINSSVRRKRVSGYKGRMLLITVRQTDASGSVFDMAGRVNKSSVFARNLSRKFGDASRTMWPAADKNRALVHASLKASVLEVERQINQELRRRV
jgi:hypothetical protein